MRHRVESYMARNGETLKEEPAAVQTPFTIEVRFLGGLTPTQKAAFRTAADRWTRVIVGDLPAIQVEGEIIDDIVILAQGAPIDGPGGILGQAGPTRIRPASAGAAAFLPAKGKMIFDTADLAKMQQNGTLVDVITHEMGHVLGIGTVWKRKGLIADSGTNHPTFIGANAQHEYGLLTGAGDEPVPVENEGGQGTAESHWDEQTFGNELMSGFVSTANNPLSRLTVASLKDLGYVVDMSAAEPYELPLLNVTAAGAAVEALDLSNAVLPIIPLELSDADAV